jgi:plastocyanin
MKKTRIFTLCLGMILTCSFWGCKKDTSDIGIEQDQKIKATAAGKYYYGGTVNIQNSAFDPSELYVRETATVVWVNKDNTIHTVTANDGTFDSGDLQPGATFSYTFNTHGDYYYHCKYHSEMTGVIKAVVIIK